jgi:hypothetical protein
METDPSRPTVADRIWIILAVIFLAAIAYLIATSRADGATPQPIPTPFDVSKVDFSKFSPEEIAATEAHRDQLKGEVAQTEAQLSVVIDTQGSSIQDIKKATDDSRKAFDQYVKETEERITQGNKAIAAYNVVNKKNHRAQWVLIAQLVAIVGLIYLKLPLRFKTYGLYGAGSVLVAGIAFIKLWL